MSNQYYNQLLNANFAADYQTPDWLRTADFRTDYDPAKMEAFFKANPQYAEDWARITSGGKSAFSTDGTTLIKSNFANMSPEAAAYYAQNPNDLLAVEGFGQDPTLSYMNYMYGKDSIGAPKNGLATDFLRTHQYTPGGIVAGQSAGGAPLGSGYQSYLTARNGLRIGGSPSGPQVTTGIGGYGGTSGSVGYTQQPGMNPYLQQAMDATSNNITQNWNNNVKPAIASQAMAAGGYGGSRQGVIESNSANDMNQGLSNALANLAFNGYNSGLQYDLGLMNNSLGFANLDRTINNDNIANQMLGANLGLNVWDRLMQNNQTGLNAGTNIQNTPLNYWQQFGQQANSIGQGYGTQTSSGSTQGNPMLGALGGAQLGSQIGNWWSGGSGTGLTGVNAPSSGYQIGSYNYGLGNGSGGLGLSY